MLYLYFLYRCNFFTFIIIIYSVIANRQLILIYFWCCHINLLFYIKDIIYSKHHKPVKLLQENEISE